MKDRPVPQKARNGNRNRNPPFQEPLSATFQNRPINWFKSHTKGHTGIFTQASYNTGK